MKLLNIYKNWIREPQSSKFILLIYKVTFIKDPRKKIEVCATWQNSVWTANVFRDFLDAKGFPHTWISTDYYFENAMKADEGGWEEGSEGCVRWGTIRRSAPPLLSWSVQSIFYLGWEQEEVQQEEEEEKEEEQQRDEKLPPSKGSPQFVSVDWDFVLTGGVGGAWPNPNFLSDPGIPGVRSSVSH